MFLKNTLLLSFLISIKKKEDKNDIETMKNKNSVEIERLIYQNSYEIEKKWYWNSIILI